MYTAHPTIFTILTLFTLVAENSIFVRDHRDRCSEALRSVVSYSLPGKQRYLVLLHCQLHVTFQPGLGRESIRWLTVCLPRDRIFLFPQRLRCHGWFRVPQHNRPCSTNIPGCVRSDDGWTLLAVGGHHGLYHPRHYVDQLRGQCHRLPC